MESFEHWRFVPLVFPWLPPLLSWPLRPVSVEKESQDWGQALPKLLDQGLQSRRWRTRAWLTVTSASFSGLHAKNAGNNPFSSLAGHHATG